MGAGLPAQPEEAREVDPGSGGGGGIEAIGGIDEGGEGSPSRRAREEGGDEARAARGGGAVDLGELAPAGSRRPGGRPRYRSRVGRGNRRRSSPRKGRSVALQPAGPEQLLEGGLGGGQGGRHVSLFLRHPGAKTARCQARLSLQCSPSVLSRSRRVSRLTGAPPASAYVPPTHPLKEMQCPGPGSSCSSLSSGAPAPSTASPQSAPEALLLSDAEQEAFLREAEVIKVTGRPRRRHRLHPRHAPQGRLRARRPHPDHRPAQGPDLPRLGHGDRLPRQLAQQRGCLPRRPAPGAGHGARDGGATIRDDARRLHLVGGRRADDGEAAPRAKGDRARDSRSGTARCSWCARSTSSSTTSTATWATCSSTPTGRSG